MQLWVVILSNGLIHIWLSKKYLWPQDNACVHVVKEHVTQCYSGMPLGMCAFFFCFFLRRHTCIMSLAMLAMWLQGWQCWSDSWSTTLIQRLYILVQTQNLSICSAPPPSLYSHPYTVMGLLLIWLKDKKTKHPPTWIQHLTICSLLNMQTISLGYLFLFDS